MKAIKRILTDCKPTRRDVIHFTDGAMRIASATHILVNGPTPVVFKLPNRRKKQVGFGKFVALSVHELNAQAASELERMYAEQARMAKAKAGRLLEISDSRPYRVIGERSYDAGSK